MRQLTVNARVAAGVVVMTVLFSSGWSGMAFIEDIDRGVMDRMLAAPVRKGAMMASSTVYQGVQTVVQSLVDGVVRQPHRHRC